MVNNKLYILDEGQNKMCPEVIEMTKPKYIHDFEYKLLCYKTKRILLKQDRDRMITSNRYGGQEYASGYNKEKYDKACLDYNCNYNEFFEKWLMEYEMNKNSIDKIHWKSKEICDFMDVIPFTPSVMINISPDWSGIKRTEKNKVNILKGIIDNYMKEGWYDRWDYVIECGSEGDHIHAHIVAHMNVTRLKSTETHLAKGRHSVQLIKYAKKLKGMEGIIKGIGIQKTFLRTQELVDDKLKYLKEEFKPQGHTNHHVIDDGYVVGSL